MGSSAKERESVTGHVDKYRSFAELSARERLGEDYTIDVVEQDSPVAIIAPHGGKIEPSTSEIVRSIAAEDYNFYAFEGIKPAGNNRGRGRAGVQLEISRALRNALRASAANMDRFARAVRLAVDAEEASTA